MQDSSINFQYDVITGGGGDAALLANPKPVDEIAEGIQLLCNDSILRDTLRVEGLLDAVKFSWSAPTYKCNSY